MALCLIAGVFSNRRKNFTLVFRKDLTRITPKMYKIIATKQIGSQTKIRRSKGGDIIWGLGKEIWRVRIKRGKSGENKK
jgi:hypothetical protein